MFLKGVLFPRLMEKAFYFYGGVGDSTPIFVSENGNVKKIAAHSWRPNLLYGTRVYRRPDEPNDIEPERAVTLIRFNSPEELKGRIYAVRHDIACLDWRMNRIAHPLEMTPELVDVFEVQEPRYDEDAFRYWADYRDLFHGVGSARAGVSQAWENLQTRLGKAIQDEDETAIEQGFREQDELHQRIVAQIRPDEFPKPMQSQVTGLDDVLLAIPVSPAVPTQYLRSAF